MWQITNKTPFAADYAWVLDNLGNKLWLVVVKATFDIKPDGSCLLAAANEPIHAMAKAYGEFGQTSLEYDADTVGVKPATDVLVRGAAMAPKGKRVTALDVSLRIGAIQKRLRVTGDRVWERNSVGTVRMSAPEHFQRMPVTYERAYGGWDRRAEAPADHRMEGRNPVGTGFAVRSEHCFGLHLPNVEYPDQLINSWKDRPAPAGFNVVDCAWSPRRELAGTYDDAWRRSRFPLWAADFDNRYYNAAPADQQAASYIAGGERVEVLNMSPSGSLSFALPRVRLSFRTRFGSQRIDHEGHLCMVTIEPNLPRIVLAWQTSLVCNRNADQLDETLIAENFSFP